MDVPTTTALLERIKNGEIRVGLIPCPADRLPVPGDVLTFREAIFELGAPSLVPNGGSASVTLTAVYDTHEPYLGFTLCTLRWDG
jgi:hypothetical protein